MTKKLKHLESIEDYDGSSHNSNHKYKNIISVKESFENSNSNTLQKTRIPVVPSESDYETPEQFQVAKEEFWKDLNASIEWNNQRLDKIIAAQNDKKVD